ncbi:unknown [[Mannheimia] succiniciproducens MBEL55E]|uniref:Uncharacterized protein n=1 Tax=Mannheimia succiniciproducens (strain KCTC 0769BP / MBEL55E) TaxID=221988 RepID=Q65WI3_MANSM|nr:unknown [[Mannheimia] succiniciproducens MBEL55E]
MFILIAMVFIAIFLLVETLKSKMIYFNQILRI